VEGKVPESNRGKMLEVFRYLREDWACNRIIGVLHLAYHSGEFANFHSCELINIMTVDRTLECCLIEACALAQRTGTAGQPPIVLVALFFAQSTGISVNIEAIKPIHQPFIIALVPFGFRRNIFDIIRIMKESLPFIVSIVNQLFVVVEES